LTGTQFGVFPSQRPLCERSQSVVIVSNGAPVIVFVSFNAHPVQGAFGLASSAERNAPSQLISGIASTEATTAATSNLNILSLFLAV
jgi:hypothetical protein